MMNLKNVIENLALTIIALIIGVFIGFTVSIKTTERIVESQEATIREAIRKETTAINNTVNNQFDKIKSNKSEPINIIIKPDSKSTIETNSVNQETAIETTPEDKKSFIGRLLSGDPKKKAERKARREKKRNNK